MSKFEDSFKELSLKISDEGLRDSLLSVFKEMEVELGTRGKDLNLYKSDALTYKKLKDTLKAIGVDDPSNVDKVAEKLKINKDAAEEKEALTAIAKQLAEEKKAIEKEYSQFKVKTTLTDKFNSARNNFKDEKGKGIKIADDFIDNNKLFAELDLSNELLVQQRIDGVLKEAYDKQAKLVATLGIPGFTPPSVPEGNQPSKPSTVSFQEQLKVSTNEFGNNRATSAGAFVDAVRKSQGIT